MSEKLLAEKIIEVKDVSFSYGKSKVLKNVSMEILRGDFVGMIGPNGSGKTTLIKILLGLLKQDSGTVKLFGKDISKFKDKHKIGYVPQKATNFEQNFPATAFEVASMGRFQKIGLMKQLSEKDKQVIETFLKLVGMFEFRNKPISDLSGGQQQRVFIARALAAESELLILDEPTVGVDRQAQNNFYSILRKLNKEMKITIILISHDTGMISSHVNKLACVNRSLVFHDLSKGVNTAELFCAYGPKTELISHTHNHM